MNENLVQNETEEIVKERRFEIPVESLAKERLDDFRDSVKQMQKEHPQVLGATIYGSMIKGNQARVESDVDAFLYIDVEDTQIAGQSQSDYREKLLEKLGASGNDKSKYYEDVRVQPISNEIIDKEINDQLDFYKKSDEYRKILSEKYGGANEEEREQLLKLEPTFRTIQFGIAGMFHARVGSGIEKYRKAFLEKIAANNDESTSERIWGEVSSQLRTMEQRRDPNIQIETPDTLKDAMQKYNPELAIVIRKKADQEKINDLQREILKLK